MQNVTNQLLDRYQDVTGLKTSYAVAKALGLQPPTVYGYRSGKSQMDVTTAKLVAERIGADPLEVIARLEIERAPTERVKTAWSRNVGRPLLALALTTGATLAIYGSLLNTDYTHAAALLPAGITSEFVYITRN